MQGCVIGVPGTKKLKVSLGTQKKGTLKKGTQ